ncbi:MAG TPA: hypothetical protein VMP01_09945 [Pirellulaceae bacterium]|nr:hypothetical protein [Pirellulaceae bacterium]
MQPDDGTDAQNGPSPSVEYEAGSGDRFLRSCRTWPPFAPRPDRDAYATIRGFVYQADLTILRWLELRPGQALDLESGEDIDLIADALNTNPFSIERLLEKVKHRESNVTLRSDSALEAITVVIDKPYYAEVQAVTKQLVVRAKKPFKITSIRGGNESLAFKTPEESKPVHLVPVIFTAGKEAGEFEYSIEIETDLASGGKTSCVVRGSVETGESTAAR